MDRRWGWWGAKGVMALLVVAAAGTALADTFSVVDWRVDPVPRRCVRAKPPVGTPPPVLMSFGTLEASGPSITEEWCDRLGAGTTTGHGSLVPPCPLMSCAPADTALPGGCHDHETAPRCLPATTFFYVQCWPLDATLSTSTSITGGTWSGGKCTVQMMRTCTYTSDGAVLGPSAGVPDCVP